ncbi:abortive infection protein [Halostagnicola larsenii XH-48]|uniref:Abortive infection protein n=1 Tax=Halostagnicola larsenii XH-48 TaxID=797299 RepID=W0JHY2_9EURY|nr:CPBP family intramembrane glutamic endopeptidase [Halostagnicola larsenii]AHF98305.1 abortive infection protein [Halostagnicola larsenii XH-48]
MDDPQSAPPSASEQSPPTDPPSRSALIAILGSIGYILGAFIFTFAVFFVLMLGAMIYLAVTTGDIEQFDAFIEGEGFVLLAGMESGLLGLGALGLAALSVVRGWIPKAEFGLSRPTRRQIGVSLLAIVGLVVLQAALSLASSALGIPASEHSLIGGDVSPYYYVALAVISILVIGPAEELLFRGLIQNYMRPAFGSTGAIVGTSILFSSIHLPAYFTTTLSAAIVSLGVIFVLSVAFGWLYERYNNLYLVMWIHGGYNATLFLLQATL